MRTNHCGNPATRSAVHHGRGKLLRRLDPKSRDLSPRMLETHPLPKASVLGTLNVLLQQRRKPDGVELVEY